MRWLFLLVLTVLCPPASAQLSCGNTIGGMGGVSNSVCFLGGAFVDLPFGTPSFLPSSAVITEARSSIATEDDLNGNWYQFASGVFRQTTKGHLGEEARTNSVRNSAATGVTTGSPGSVTDWGLPGTASGITQTVVGSGVESGINYVDVNLTGTPTSSQYIVSFDTTLFTASAGQIWTESSFVKMSGGSLSNITSQGLELIVFNSVPSFISNCTTSATPTSASLTSQRQQCSAIGISGTAYVQPSYYINVTTGQAVNVTLRFGWPQLELNPNATTAAMGFATSPIPTSGTTITRAQDNPTMPLPTGSCTASGCSVFYQAIPESPNAYSTNEFLGTVNAGSTTNYTGAYMTTGATAGITVIGGTITQANPSGSVTQGTSGKLSVYAVPNQISAVLNNGTVATGTPTGIASGFTQLNIGTQVGTSPCNCYIQRIAVAPTSLLAN